MTPRWLPICGAPVILTAALFAATSASSAPSAGIRVSPSRVVASVQQTDLASGVSIVAVSASATWSPDAQATEGRIEIKDLTNGGTQGIRFGNPGGVPRSSDTFRHFFGAAAGTLYVIRATWRVYEPGGLKDGTAVSLPSQFQVPKPEPVGRLTDTGKQDMAGVAFALVPAAGVMLCAAGLAAAVGPVGLVLAGAALIAIALYAHSISKDPIDPNFRAVAKPVIPPVPRISAGPGLTAAAAAALTRMLRIQMQEIGLSRAILTAFNRSQGAFVKKETTWERKQMLAAGRYAAQLATAMRVDVRVRPQVGAALVGSALDVTVSSKDAYAFEEVLVRKGLPTSLPAVLSKLGMTKLGQKEARAQLLALDPSLYTGNTIDALTGTKPVAALRKMAGALDVFAKKAARDPLHTGA